VEWVEDENAFNCDKCQKIFGSVPKKFRPRCENVKDGVCPKGVPILLPANEEVWFIFNAISSSLVDPMSGMFRFDLSVVNSACRLFDLDEVETIKVAGKILYLVETFNVFRNKKTAKDKPR